jgi:TonB-linked SusC/RagA family outer membrane protein
VLKSSINIDLGQSAYNSFQPSTAGRGFASAPSALNANLFMSNTQYWSWLSENTVDYSKQINDHSIGLLAGYTVQRFHSDYSTISGSNFPDDRVSTINGALTKNPSTQDIQEWGLISYIARLNYNYKGKYFLGASIRRDGSSRFGANNKWGNFPSVSAGWLVSDESFVNNLHWLSFLKIRGSYGLIGNNNIGNYTQYASVSTSANSPFNNQTQSGSAVTSMPNSLLGWESTRELDLGFDLGLLKDRINLTYDYYIKRTTNLLFQIQVAQESGFSNFQTNVGNIRFWGHEIGLQTNNLVGAFKWSSNFNIAFGDNKVLALSGLSDRLYAGSGSATTITRIGGRIGQFWGLVQDGVYKDQTDFDKSPKAINSRVGTIKFRDLDNSGSISTANDGGDKTIIGNPFPKFIFGFTNTFSYKNFDLGIVVSGTYGNKIARMMDQGTSNLDGVFNVLKDVKDRWRSPSNPGAGKYGTTSYNTGDERDLFHSRFIQDGSFLTIKNIALGYTIPLANSRAFRSIRIFTSCQQALVLTKYNGANPEISTDSNGNQTGSLAQGLDFSAYPVPRTFTLGANISLK